MARHTSTLGARYFEDMFRGTSDPWNLESSPYELAKYDASIAALDGRSYRNAFEVGCAKGVLTSKLAPRCAALLSIDVSETALAAARARIAHCDHVAFEQTAFPARTPTGRFDLVVWSEVAYYWDDADLERAAAWLKSDLDRGGDLLLVHFTGETDYPLTGDEAAELFIARMQGIAKLVRHDRHHDFRLDVLTRG